MLTLEIGKRSYPVADLEAASARYQKFRGMKPSSLCPTGFVYDGRRLVARISYNGRVWPPLDWQDGMKPLREATEVQS
jgi:hypothetical protein